MSTLPMLPCQAIAVYSWSGEQDSDLGMIEGDKIEVLDYGDGDWWFGKLQRNKMQGVFPKNYVKIYEVPRSNSVQSLANSSSHLRMSKSPSFAKSPSSRRLQNSISYQQFPHSRSQQFYQDPEESQTPKLSKSSAHKYFSVNDLQSYSQRDVTRMRQPINIESSSEEEDDDDDDGEDDAPPPPPPKTRSSRDNMKRQSIFSDSSPRSSPLSSSYNTPPHSSLGPNNKNFDFNMLKNSMVQRGSITGAAGLDLSTFSAQQQQQLFDSLMSTDSERSVAFGHSNFSATSAGSLARHKYRHELEERDAKIKEVQQSGGLQNFEDRKEQAEILKQVFVDTKKQSRHPKLLKKLFSKEESKAATLDEQIHGLSLNLGNSDICDTSIEEELGLRAIPPRQSDDDDDTYSTDRDPRLDILNQVIMPSEIKAKREERAIMENPYFILKPFSGINEKLNNNEAVVDYGHSHKKNYINIDSIPLYHVDKFIRYCPIDKYDSIESVVINVVAKNFNSDLEKIRAIYCLCTERIELIPVEFEKMDSNVSPKMTDIIFYKKATPHQLTWLFKAMANALHIKSEIVLGHFKHPFQDLSEIALGDKLVPNHSWCSMIIEGQWRVLDVVLGNVTNEFNAICNVDEVNADENRDFYFLAKPLDVISTHIPIIIEQQHILPPIDTMVALALPPRYPGYFKYGLKFYKYNNALTHLKDLEIAEFQVQVPNDVDLFVTVGDEDSEMNNTTQDTPQEDLSKRVIAQPYWSKHRKFYSIRATLPKNSSMSFLKIYAGDKRSRYSDYSLCSSIQLYHRGICKPLTFAKRYPTIHTFNQDLFVQKPQLYNLDASLLNSHRSKEIEFLIKQHPSFEIDQFNRQVAITKLALQDPEGHIHRLERVDGTSKIYGDWGIKIDLRTISKRKGLWRGLVLTDDGASWSVFCEWKSS